MRTTIFLFKFYTCALFMLSHINAGSNNEPHPLMKNKILEKVKHQDSDISFYGKVLSDENVPISGANVTIGYGHFSPLASWGQGISSMSTHTDKAGLFEFSGFKGSYIRLKSINFPGYEFLRMYSGNEMSFNYRKNDPTAFTPNKTKPITYNIRKMGPKSFIFTNDRHVGIKTNLGEKKSFYYEVFNQARLIEESQISELPYDVSIHVDYLDAKKCVIVFKVPKENDALLHLNYPFMRSNDKVTEKSAICIFHQSVTGGWVIRSYQN